LLFTLSAILSKVIFDLKSYVWLKSIKCKNIYSIKEEKLVLVLLLNLSFKLNIIFINASKLFSSFISYYLLTTYSANYYSENCILIFLKREISY